VTAATFPIPGEPTVQMIEAGTGWDEPSGAIT